MSCGTRIRPRFNTFSERDELARKLEDQGEHNLAHDVRHDRCLSSYQLRCAERALDNEGLSKHFDYRTVDCPCDPEYDGEQ